MTSQEKDRYIVEWFGECWHEAQPSGRCACKKCGCDPINPYLTSETGFFKLWGWMRKNEKLWVQFLNWLYDKRQYEEDDIGLYYLIDNRIKFRDTVFEFLQTQKGEK